MNNFKKTKINIAILAFTSLLGSQVLAQESNLNVDFSGNANTEQNAAKLKKELAAKQAAIVASQNKANEQFPIKSNEGYAGSINPYEKGIIDKKEHVLLKYLYEQQKLEELRAILESYEKDKAYKDAVDQRVPLSPEQILELRKLLRDAEIAKTKPLQGPIENNIRTIDIDVDAPKPIVLNVAPGYASSIVFFDYSGSPWPIDGDIIGNKTAFDSKPGSKESNHSAVFEIKKEFTQSNALINLVGLNVPIVVRLNGNDSSVDARLSVRIPKFGPNAQMQTYASSELQTVSDEALRVLDGDKLPGGKRFRLSGVEGEVTYANETLYIRTRANLISPPWKNMVNSTTGYKVYELPPVNNLLFSIDGEMRNATIEKSFEVKLEQRKSIFSDN